MYIYTWSFYYSRNGFKTDYYPVDWNRFSAILKNHV